MKDQPSPEHRTVQSLKPPAGTDHMLNTGKNTNGRIRSICLMGASVDCQNRGVLALGASLVKLVLEQVPDARISFLVGSRNDAPVPIRVGDDIKQIPVMNNRLSVRSGLRKHLLWIFIMSVFYRILPFSPVRRIIKRSTPWIRTTAEADIIGDIRGGDSFSDLYGLRNFLLNSIEMISAVLVHGDIVLLPQTYGPFSSPVSRVIARWIVNHSSTILTRGHQKLDFMNPKAGKGYPEMEYCPDVAFALQAASPSEIEAYPPLIGKLNSGVIGINVNGLMYNGGFTRDNMFELKVDYRTLLPQLVTALLQAQPNDVLLVPHTYGIPGTVESDLDSAFMVRNAVAENLQDRIHVITGNYDQHELKGIIGMCDFFIGSRMHACIAALSQSIPCVGVAYSRKFSGVFDSVGMGDWVIDGRTEDNATVVKRIVSLYQDREQAREKLCLGVERAREQIRNAFTRLLSVPAQDQAAPESGAIRN